MQRKCERPKMVFFYIPDRIWNSQTICLRTSTSVRDRPDRGEEQGNLQGESDGSSSILHQDSLPDDGEARNDFWSISGNYTYRHHVEPRVKLYVPREESFPITIRCIHVARTTSTTLDVMLGRRIEDHWNIEGDRDLSDLWTGFTRLTTLDEKPPDGYTWSGWRLTKKQTTSRPYYLWPEIWKDIRSSATKRKTKVGHRKSEA